MYESCLRGPLTIAHSSSKFTTSTLSDDPPDYQFILIFADGLSLRLFASKREISVKDNLFKEHEKEQSIVATFYYLHISQFENLPCRI